MSLANYSDLLTAVANWASRADLTSRIPEGIVLCEAKVNRRLRTKDMEVRNGAFPVGGEYVGLPYGFGGIRSFYLNTSPRTIMQLVAEAELTNRFADGATGIPSCYSISANQFRFGKPPDASYTGTLTYFLKVPGLTSVANTNWLMTDHPDVYLYGVTAEMAAFAHDWQEAMAWEKKRDDSLLEIITISNKDRWSGSTIAQRPG